MFVAASLKYITWKSNKQEIFKKKSIKFVRLKSTCVFQMFGLVLKLTRDVFTKCKVNVNIYRWWWCRGDIYF